MQSQTTAFQRIFRQGTTNFKRQGSMSGAAILIMIITLTLIGLLFVLRGITDHVVTQLKESIDVSVYFREEVLEEEILSAREELKKLSEIREVEYIPATVALDRFRSRYEDDPVIMESLVEVGGNPFLASLNIKVWEAKQYESVVNFIEASKFESLIDRVDYRQNKDVIDKMFSIASGLTRALIVVSLVLGLMAVVVGFNSVKLSIANSQKEIEVMHLVGANRFFVAGPFMVQGALMGLAAVVFSMSLLFLAAVVLTSPLKSLAADFNLLKYLIGNFFIIFLFELVLGAGLGMISAWLAVRRYLK